jgi:phosphohistidine phosphatase
MRLLIVRHAKAFDRDPARWPDDSKRTLTDEGRKAFRRLARRLERWVDVPTFVLASSWNRAWETAEILAEEAGWPEPVRDELLEDADETHASAGLLERLGSMRTGGGAAIVGHEPFLSRFASRLLSGRSDGIAIDLRKGAVLELEVDPDGPLGASLQTLVHPGVYRRSS